ncbi:hypothetical protein [Oceanobacillus sp. CFH 90083]|uniref:hypothetical protein n=1 Tax=Oceanobacillus sp. CFH 90083 TaxID=2592336 RepID=UPI00128C1C1C|nr:hypothetical protein [Oceanobacillus sp. CFH 90083]
MGAHKEMLDAKRHRLRVLKQHRKRVGKVEATRIDGEIAEMERYLKRFGLKVMQPARVKNIVINQKVYRAMLRKLKGYAVNESVQGDKLILTYRSPDGSTRGKAVLYDLSEHFPYNADFPEIEI